MSRKLSGRRRSVSIQMMAWRKPRIFCQQPKNWLHHSWRAWKSFHCKQFNCHSKYGAGEQRFQGDSTTISIERARSGRIILMGCQLICVMCLLSVLFSTQSVLICYIIGMPSYLHMRVPSFVLFSLNLINSNGRQSCNGTWTNEFHMRLSANKNAVYWTWPTNNNASHCDTLDKRFFIWI